MGALVDDSIKHSSLLFILKYLLLVLSYTSSLQMYCDSTCREQTGKYLPLSLHTNTFSNLFLVRMLASYVFKQAKRSLATMTRELTFAFKTDLQANTQMRPNTNELFDFRFYKMLHFNVGRHTAKKDLKQSHDKKTEQSFKITES